MAELNSLKTLLGPNQLDALGLTTNCKGWWKFDDNGGTTVTDAMGLHNGTASRAAINGAAAGKFGYCGTFASASSDKVTLTDHADLKPTGSFSILGWIKTSTSANQGIFQSWNEAANIAGIYLKVTATNKVQFYSGKNSGTVDGTDYAQVISNTSIADGNWHFVVAVWDGSYLRLYIDGVFDNSKAWANAPVYNATNYVRIGCEYYTSDTSFFNGYLDDIQIINGTALTADQVARLYGASVYWRLEGNSNDSKGANNGTDTAITYSAANGKYGQGAGFNGSSSKIIISDAAALKPTSPFTIVTWANFSSSSATGLVIFQSWAIPSSKLSGIWLAIADGKLRLISGKNTGITPDTDFKILNSTNTHNDGKYHNICALWDGSNLKIYVDGVLDGSVAWSNVPVYAATNYVRIGCENTSGTDQNFYPGLLDDVVIFPRALTADEVKQLYKELSSAWFLFM